MNPGPDFWAKVVEDRDRVCPNAPPGITSHTWVLGGTCAMCGASMPPEEMDAHREALSRIKLFGDKP